MRIKIVSIDKSNVIEVSGSTLGYVGKFECSMVSGEAILVPATDREESLVPGAILSVETSQERVSDFKIICINMAHSITPLSQNGDYHVVGSVDLNGDDEVFFIDVGDFTFIIDIDETNGSIPQKGDTVDFIIHGLSLWDENI